MEATDRPGDFESYLSAQAARLVRDFLLIECVPVCWSSPLAAHRRRHRLERIIAEAAEATGYTGLYYSKGSWFQNHAGVKVLLRELDQRLEGRYRVVLAKLSDLLHSVLPEPKPLAPLEPPEPEPTNECRLVWHIGYDVTGPRLEFLFNLAHTAGPRVVLSPGARMEDPWWRFVWRRRRSRVDWHNEDVLRELNGLRQAMGMGGYSVVVWNRAVETWYVQNRQETV